MKRLVNLADVVDSPISGVAVLEKLATERARVKEMLQAILKGARFMKDNRQETLTTMADFLGITPAQPGRAYDVDRFIYRAARPFVNAADLNIPYP